jgi:ubiquinone/menaquinone biosynthesis C-methylase UbiE
MSKEYFNSRAAIWDEKVAEQDHSRLQAMADRLDIKTGDSVLDVGTGTGVFVPFLLNKIGTEGKLMCLDFAEEMLKICTSKGFRGNISYLCADIENSQLSGQSFDAVVCYSVFPHFQNKSKILSEIFHLLKKGGQIFICHTSSRQAINNIHRSLPEVCDHLFPENEEVRRLLFKAGFLNIEIEDGKEDYLAAAMKPAD